MVSPLNSIEFSKEPVRRAPISWDKELAPWFIKEEPADRLFDTNCEWAIVGVGIGGNECPDSTDLAIFAVGGAIIAALSGKYLIPAEPPYGVSMGSKVWDILWQQAEGNPHLLDRHFLGAMLRIFQPRWNNPGGPSRGYYISFFEDGWNFQRYT